MARICGHFQAETNSLNIAGVRAHRDQGFTDRLGPTLAQAAIVFLCAAFVGEPGDNDLAVALLEKPGDLLDFVILGAVDRLAVEVEVNRLKLIAIDVAAEKGGPFLALGERGAGHVIAGRAGGLAFLVCAGGEESQTEQEKEKKA